MAPRAISKAEWGPLPDTLPIEVGDVAILRRGMPELDAGTRYATSEPVATDTYLRTPGPIVVPSPGSVDTPGDGPVIDSQITDSPPSDAKAAPEAKPTEGFLPCTDCGLWLLIFGLAVGGLALAKGS